MEEIEDGFIQKWNESEFIDGVYIPNNIKECFLELDKLLDKDTIKMIKEYENPFRCSINLHMGLGTFIRNKWGLWAMSRLQKYLRERSCFDSDDMSGRILSFYWEWLNGIDDNWKKFDINKRI